MNLFAIRRELAKVERAVKIADEGGYEDLLREFMDRRSATNILATYEIPRSNADLRFLIDLSDELLEFIEDEPVSEDAKSQAFEAIKRINRKIRESAL
jgi:hypothetical protein